MPMPLLCAKPSPRTDPGRRARGFTLIEVMIAVIIVGVLSALAYPAFLDSIRKGRRAEAFTALAGVQQAQERWRSSNPAYTTVLNNAAAENAVPTGLGLPTTTPSNYYALSITVATAFDYTVEATAVAGSSQANDGNCRVLGARLTRGGTVGYGSSSSVIDWNAANPDAGRCWAK